jgi:hypothetical protein
MKPSDVVKKVQQGLGNPKVSRSGKEVDKFNLDVHRRCWRKFKIRPPTGSQNPEATDWKFCIYDEMHKDYGYTPAWVKFLVEKLKDEAEFESLYDSAHMDWQPSKRPSNYETTGKGDGFPGLHTIHQGGRYIHRTGIRAYS